MPVKTESVFWKQDRLASISNNISRYEWARESAGQLVKKADHWLGKSDEELWELMFGCTLTRSWFVWSDGHCPSCKRQVPMYSWIFNAKELPWKVSCPHCGGIFPKNDFYSYYKSGLDGKGIFRHELADRKLLCNCEHPDIGDPLHYFGVDDGNGYIEDGNRWLFIAAYLIFGQWKQLVLGGVKCLGEAYIVSGDALYAHKAAIMLDRIADLFPDFSFIEQGVMYEEKPYVDGFVSYSVDHCIEVRQLAEAYDRIFDAISEDTGLVAFLAGKAKKLGLPNKKQSFGDIQANIEENLLVKGISDPMKLDCNFPQEHITRFMAEAILKWPENCGELRSLAEYTVEKATCTDGVTGEKGLASYAAWALRELAVFLSEYSVIDTGFLPAAFIKYPKLKRTYLFHIDTWCLGRYYPAVGDTGWFACTIDSYAGNYYDDTKTECHTFFERNNGIRPSMFTFFGLLYRITEDPVYMKVVYKENGNSTGNLPWDIACADPESFQALAADIIKRCGTELGRGSINMEDWHLALLRSGSGTGERVLWLSYDSDGGKVHGHSNGMNMGLFAKGLDLMPDFGYLPVQYGGWFTDKALWYMKTAAHNTVSVDGRDHFKEKAGVTTLWADEKGFRAVTVSGREIAGAMQFERTAVMIDISECDSYIVDIFRATGGREHVMFMHSHFGSLSTAGLELEPTEEYGRGILVKDFMKAGSPEPGWSAEWKIQDYYRILEGNPDIRMRYTGLTGGVQVNTASAWVSAGDYNIKNEMWIPCLLQKSTADTEPLATAFAGVIEPFTGASHILSIRRLDLFYTDGIKAHEADICIEVVLVSGRRDVIISLDAEDPLSKKRDYRDHTVVAAGTGLSFNGRLCMASYGDKGIRRIVSVGAVHLEVEGLLFEHYENPVTRVFEFY